MSLTLADRQSQRDSERLVGRRSELTALDRLFGDDAPASVVLVHGPGGIGKSMLLRELARRGRLAGWGPTLVDGRDLHPALDALEDALGPVRELERPLLLFDSYERIQAMDGYIRREVVPALSQRAIVVIAGRGPPGRGWFDGGWEALTMELELEPLSSPDSTELLRTRGVHDERIRAELIAWADGSPLALAMAADTARRPEDWTPHHAIERPRIVQALIRRLTDGEIDSAHVSVLAVAAIARVTTPDLLRAVLPTVDADGAFDWLASRSFADPLGDGVTLHELVRKALDADLRWRDPERERFLRRRIADHLHHLAVERNLLLSIDLAHLVRSEAIRWGYSWQGSTRHRIDDLRPGDAQAIAGLLRARGHEGLYRASRPFFAEAPDRVSVARDADDSVCGYQVSATPATAPEFAHDHPLLGPWLQHARERSRDGVILVTESVDFTRDPRSGVQALLGMAGILRSGLTNPRFAYLPINPRSRPAVEFSAAVGAHHVAELDKEFAGLKLECHVIDYGPGGLLGAQRDFVYAELGLEPPGRARAIGERQVRDVLRKFGVPHKLAESPLCRGAETAERAASVRALIEQARECAFGDTPDERLLKRVLVRGYLEPAASHEAAADELHLSRSAYFRRLKQATRRVTEYLAAHETG